MEIIDSQIHDPHPVERVDPKFSGEFELLLGCELAREAMDAVGVDRALLNTRQDLIDYAVNRYPERFAGCLSGFDVRTPGLERRVRTFRERPGMLALRISVVDWATRQVTAEFGSGLYEPLLTAAEKFSVPVFLGAFGVPRAVAPVAAAHPKLTLIVDHIGLPVPPVMRLDRDPWHQLPDVIALARFPNVAVKMTAPNALSKRPYPHDDIWPHLHRLLDAFGADRLVFASDFTRLRMAPGIAERGRRDQWAALYSDSVSYLRDTNEISQGDKELIFGGAIRRLLRWPNDHSGPHR